MSFRNKAENSQAIEDKFALTNIKPKIEKEFPDNAFISERPSYTVHKEHNNFGLATPSESFDNIKHNLEFLNEIEASSRVLVGSIGNHLTKKTSKRFDPLQMKNDSLSDISIKQVSDNDYVKVPSKINVSPSFGGREQIMKSKR